MTLGKAIGRLARRVRSASGGSGQTGGLEEGPRSAFELVTRRGLDDVVRDFERLEVKVNGLIFGVALTFILEVWKSFR